MKSVIDNHEDMGKHTLADFNIEGKQLLHERVVDTISVLSKRLRKLRESKVKKSFALERLFKLAGDDWRNSTYSYAVSNTKTQLYRISSSIDQTLLCIDKLGFGGASCVDASVNYVKSDVVNLSLQANYVCLQECDISEERYYQSLPFIEQKSMAWFNVRKKLK